MVLLVLSMAIHQLTLAWDSIRLGSEMHPPNDEIARLHLTCTRSRSRAKGGTITIGVRDRPTFDPLFEVRFREMVMAWASIETSESGGDQRLI